MKHRLRVISVAVCVYVCACAHVVSLTVTLIEICIPFVLRMAKKLILLPFNLQITGSVLSQYQEGCYCITVAMYCTVCMTWLCAWMFMTLFSMRQGYDQQAEIIMMEITCVHHFASQAFIEVVTADL